MLAMLNDAVPEFESVTVWAMLGLPKISLPNARAARERPAAGEPPVAAAPVPVSVTPCGLGEALSVMVSVPARDPVTEGVKVTLMAQLVPAPTLVPQLFVWAKSPLAGSLQMLTLEMLRAAVPLFVRVTAWPA